MLVRYYTILLCSILIYQEYWGKKKIDNIFFIKGSPSIFDMCKNVAKMTKVVAKMTKIVTKMTKIVG